MLLSAFIKRTHGVITVHYEECITQQQSKDQLFRYTEGWTEGDLVSVPSSDQTYTLGDSSWKSYFSHVYMI